MPQTYEWDLNLLSVSLGVQSKKMDNLDVLVIGRNCVDYIAVVEDFPAENTKVPLKNRMMEGGGQGGTSSCCISQLGGKVACVGTLGADDEGRFCLKRLKDYNVITNYFKIMHGGRTPIAYLFVTESNGNRTIIYEKNDLPKIGIIDIPPDLISQASVILLDPETTYLGADLRALAAKNTKIVYDCERWRDGISDMMQAADYFAPSSEFLDAKELQFRSGGLPERIFELNRMVRGTLIVTNGENGAYFISAGRLHRVPAPQIRVKDTTGAGDNFHAAFSYAVSQGYGLQRSVKFSVAVASLSCREYGGRDGLPDFEEAVNLAEQLDVEIFENK